MGEGGGGIGLLAWWIVVGCAAQPSHSTQTTKIPSAVLELNDRFLEVKHEGHWFVEFYAPWCGHCKRLQPVWEQLGHALSQTGIRVARLDCTRFTRVSSEVGITGFPTLKYYRNGKEISYEGDRTKEALLDFALKVHGPEVRKLSNVDEYRSAVGKHAESGFFLLVSNDEEQDLAKEFEAAAKEMFIKVYFYSARPEDLPTDIVQRNTEVLCVKDDSIISYNPDTVDGQDLSGWMNDQRWPLFSQITYGSLYDMGTCCEKLLVIAVLDLVKRKAEGTPVRRFSELVENTARRFKDDLGRKFFFVWTDGAEMADNIIMGSMKVPSLLVFNVSTYQFFLPEDPPSEMTEDSLRLWLDAIAKGGKPPLGGRGIIQRVKRMFFEIYSALYTMFSTQPLLSCCLFGLPLGILSIICYTLCSADTSVDQEEIYKDSEEDDSGFPAHAQRNAARYYKKAINFRVPAVSNKANDPDEDEHPFSSRVKQLREFHVHFEDHTLLLSCDNKNKVHVGTVAVHRTVRTKKLFMADDAPDLQSHDFPLGSLYKMTPMGYMTVQPDGERRVIYKDGRKHYVIPATGHAYVINRAQAFHDSTIEPHINDLLKIIPKHLGNRRIVIRDVS